jgi:hypothetical protein
MTDYWFKPKTHGYGASPANWKGWAATAGFVAATVIVTLVLLVWPVATRNGSAWWHAVLWLVLLGAMTAGFIRLARHRTDGDWRWRWGKE